MTAPRRLRVSRRLGGGVPDGAVYVGRPGKWGNPYPVELGDREAAVRQYRRHLEMHPELVEAARRELAGKDLACWCPLEGPCHADILLELVNDSRCAACAGRGSTAPFTACGADLTDPKVLELLEEIVRHVAPCERCAGTGTEPEPERLTDGE